MKNIKVTFEDGHIINYKGRSTDEDDLWDMITNYSYSKGGQFFIGTGCSSGIQYKIEIL
ncbi:MAG TPA: hypothetical protein VLS94_08885 [Fusibacter sp.]|nr:hypothetical protein [Fusibacter sp.]